MKEFLVGLLFLAMVGVFAGIGVMLYPLLLALAVLLRIAVMVGLGIFAVWLLGKIIVVIWEKVIK